VRRHPGHRDPVAYARLDQVGTLPWVSSPASSAAGLAAFSAETNRSALANALRDATGVRFTELPLLRDRVWRALDRHSGSRRPPGSP
jgi:hypothetical protein